MSEKICTDGSRPRGIIGVIKLDRGERLKIPDKQLETRRKTIHRIRRGRGHGCARRDRQWRNRLCRFFSVISAAKEERARTLCTGLRGHYALGQNAVSSTVAETLVANALIQQKFSSNALQWTLQQKYCNRHSLATFCNVSTHHLEVDMTVRMLTLEDSDGGKMGGAWTRINIFIKSMKEALKLCGESEVGDKTKTYVRREEKGSVSITFENDFKELQAQGGKEDQLVQSISSELFEQDIALAEREVIIPEDGSYTVPEEEMMIQRLFQAAFDAYFDTVFSAVVCQIKEALAKKLVLEKLKMGLVHNMSGKTMRATRETVKSVEKVRMAQIEGSKFPIFISFCRADEQLVAEFLSGDEGEDPPISSV
ncbi:unnamed protein product [Cuscuta campestris]|uniref:Uncharacterized protein n=1 Tax=Cuscuta campestris TaxID=132261 RepID=A0A484KNH8_9ASTE|nr:unnamed protein product [Cuscuta campestris]